MIDRSTVRRAKGSLVLERSKESLILPYRILTQGLQPNHTRQSAVTVFIITLVVGQPYSAGRYASWELKGDQVFGLRTDSFGLEVVPVELNLERAKER